MIEKINEDLKQAMKDKDSFKLSVLRMLKSALQLEQINKKHDLSDDEVLTVLKKQVKLRKDSILEYQKYNKESLVESLNKEIDILDVYLPEQMSEEDIEKIIQDVINDLKSDGMKGMGLVMKKVNELLNGKNADMSVVSTIVKSKLSNN